jgi:hypothetical protein
MVGTIGNKAKAQADATNTNGYFGARFLLGNGLLVMSTIESALTIARYGP